MATFDTKASKVIAIIVTFFPNELTLVKALNAISKQCSKTIIISNTPNNFCDEVALAKNIPSTQVISLGKNFGIAYAQNIGILAAIDAGADFVLLMDQDSIPEDAMVPKLLSAFEGNSDSNTIAVGPSYIDPRTNIRSYFIVSRFGLPFRYKPNQKNSIDNIETAFLISSGTIISIPKLLEVGGMRSNYFIDHVDTEWCLRARNKGFSLLGVHSASMEHALGDKVKRVWLFYLRSVAHHSPLRDYYMFRNTLLMLQDVEMPFLWQCFTLFRLFPFASYFLCFTKNRVQRAKAMLLGLKHGFAGIDGEINFETNTCTPIPKTSLDPV